MNSEMVQRYIPEIVACLKPLDPAKIILFGSSTHEQAAEIGDIDLIIVTKTDEFPQNYQEKEQLYLTVAQALLPVRQRIPLDLIVHTRAMHARFIQLDSQFARHIREKGIVVYESPHP